MRSVFTLLMVFGILAPGLAGGTVVKHDAIGRELVLASPYSSQYPGGGASALTDGRLGEDDIGSGWQGYSGCDLDGTLDLGQPMTIRELSLGSRQWVAGGIFLPVRVEFLLSDDGVTFRQAAVVGHDIPLNQERVSLTFAARIDAVEARYVRVRAESIGTIPAWHGAAGAGAWLFVDEFQVNPAGVVGYVGPPRRSVGIIGVDTGHALEFTRMLNAPDAAADISGFYVVAAYPEGTRDIPQGLEIRAGVEPELVSMGVEMVDSIRELVSRVDVVLLETIDGRPHLAQALPVLAAGKPVFIDKPFAGSLADGIAIAELARHFGTPVFSSSSLRYNATAQSIAGGSIGGVLSAETLGPAVREPHHPDLFWYGIHGVENLYTVMGPGCRTVARVNAEPGRDVVVGTWDDGRTGTYRAADDFGGTAHGTAGESPTGPWGGYRPLLVAVVDFFRTEKPPVPVDETLEILAFMEAADVSKQQGGAAIELGPLMEQARLQARVKVEAALATAADPFWQAAGYRAGHSRQATAAIEHMVLASSHDPAVLAHVRAGLTGLLTGDASRDAKAFACRQLSLIGDESAVPALAQLLEGGAGLAHMARLALERIPGPAAAAALREALAKPEVADLVGLVNSIGRRRDSDAVTILGTIVVNADAELTEACLAALGNIGSAEAATILLGMGDTVPAGVGPFYAQALFACGCRRQDAAADVAAMDIFTRLRRPGVSEPVRTAAFGRLLSLDSTRAQAWVLEGLRDPAPETVRLATGFIAGTSGPDATRAFAAVLPDLPIGARIGLIGALGQRLDPTALPVLLAELSGTEENVRAAAVRALAFFSDVSVAERLIALAATPDDPLSPVAVAALAGMSTLGLDAALVAAVRRAPPAGRRALVGVLGERRALMAVPTLIAIAGDSDAATRKASLKALQDLVSHDDLPALLELLAGTTEASDRELLERVMLKAARTMENPAAQSTWLAAVLVGAQGPDRAFLIGLAPRIGGQSVLTALRREIASDRTETRDAAIRAIAAWPDAAVLDDLQSVARDSTDLTHHVIALRGIMRCVADPGQVGRVERKERLARALEVVRRDEDRQALEVAIARASSRNVALLGTATSPDGLDDDGGSGGAGAAVDGDPATFWDEQDQQALYVLRLDLPTPENVTGIALTGYEHHNFAPRDFDLVFDDAIVKTVRNAVYEQNRLVLQITPSACRRIELRITGYYGGSPGIRELEIISPEP